MTGFCYRLIIKQYIINNCILKRLTITQINLIIVVFKKEKDENYKNGGVDMKRPFQPNNHKRKKKHGFFARKLAGTNVINNRRAKGRKKLSA